CIDENAPPRRLHEDGATITMIARVGRGTDETFTAEHRHAGGCAGAEKGESTGGQVGFYSAAREGSTYRWEFAGTALAGLISSPRCANGSTNQGDSPPWAIRRMTRMLFKQACRRKRRPIQARSKREVHRVQGARLRSPPPRHPSAT